MQRAWSDRLVSFAYQYQKEAKPFKDMIEVFSEAIEKKNIASALDIGCGSGRIIRLIFEDLRLTPGYLAAIDISPYALMYAAKNTKEYQEQCKMEFCQKDISSSRCLNQWDKSTFDLITAGLSIQYAQSWDQENQRWNTEAYRRLLAEICSLLKKDGQFVFSVNVPNPDFSIIARESKKEIFASWKRIPLMLLVALIMVSHGKKLTQEANKGRYNYLPIEQVVKYLEEAGFKEIKYQLTYAGLAWVISCKKK